MAGNLRWQCIVDKKIVDAINWGSNIHFIQKLDFSRMDRSGEGFKP